ncbi:MAG: galactosyldiacylglycerol synthase [Gemmatimonadaceae bacterium]
MSVQLFEKDVVHPVFMVTDEQFDLMVASLEEESPTDTDYYIDQATIEMLEDDGADEALIGVLRSLLADRDGVEVSWRRDGDSR